MAFNDTIRGDRLHIAFFGRRNAGKSSLINALTCQPVAIVSDVPGTTTDPVYKAMELLPVGPVVLIDTAGLDDDQHSVGEERVRRTREVLRKTDFAVLVCDASSTEFAVEDEILRQCSSLSIQTIIIVNKCDLGMPEPLIKWLGDRKYSPASAKTGEGIDSLRELIREQAPKEWEPPFLRDLVQPGDTVLLVTPIDLGAPKGRLIMPQIKALRDCLDADAIPIMCKERELPTALASLHEKPALVVTDSQVFPSVAADVPDDIPLTSFSILSARQKGDLLSMVASVFAVNTLKPGDKVLIAESCSHHPLEDDIARVKIPRWLESFVGGKLQIETVPGANYPENLAEYKLVVHCGGCTLNRREMLRRQSIPAQIDIPMTNFGVLISFMKHVFPRALSPFPELYRLYSSENIDENAGVSVKNTMTE
jgi:[FeFe] hydrogenase H-cluster maturation GTPase HydF